MEDAMKMARQYARAICFRERMEMLQHKYQCKAMESRINGKKGEEEEFVQERMTIELEYKTNDQNSKINEGYMFSLD